MDSIDILEITQTIEAQGLFTSEQAAVLFLVAFENEAQIKLDKSEATRVLQALGNFVRRWRSIRLVDGKHIDRARRRAIVEAGAWLRLMCADLQELSRLRRHHEPLLHLHKVGSDGFSSASRLAANAYAEPAQKFCDMADRMESILADYREAFADVLDKIQEGRKAVNASVEIRAPEGKFERLIIWPPRSPADLPSSVGEQIFGFGYGFGWSRRLPARRGRRAAADLYVELFREFRDIMERASNKRLPSTCTRLIGVVKLTLTASKQKGCRADQNADALKAQCRRSAKRQ